MGRTGAYDKHEICSLSKLMMKNMVLETSLACLDD
jgi:hypothetical protein